MMDSFCFYIWQHYHDLFSLFGIEMVKWRLKVYKQKGFLYVGDKF